MYLENKNDDYTVEEPDWGLMIFWEDITFLLQKIAEFFKGLFGLE